ncbi:MAG TPA: condensation domain-containing protein, partial [Thermoanaerobaculia bacterium]|nr:condensation domain-containing protein [Thermoanaerobaculia bacterium]
SLGYARRPELTALAFLPDPFDRRPGRRLYRTGDRGRYGADGNLEFLGRLDHQVKVRGYRIELGEIEVVLSRQPGVREAVVLAREDEPGDQRLVAYVVAAEGAAAPVPSELRDALRQALPEYMVPGAFVLLDSLPVTANGKLDREALPAPQWGAAAAFEAARTEAEKILAGIWTDVLGVPRVGREDSFFELGGHSLLATQMVSRVRETFGIELALRSLFERPKLADLARIIEAAQTEASTEGAVLLQPVRRNGEPLPLSYAQERLWFLEQLDPGSSTYNIPVVAELTGALDVTALSEAFAEVVHRQESLRTTFIEVDGVPRQRVAPPELARLPLLDLTALPAGSATAEAGRLEQEQASRGFDLAAGPLFACQLVRLAPDRYRLLLTLHHIISDGWSIGVLLRELGALYASALTGQASTLPDLPLQYADYAVWQRQWLAERQAAELAYWEAQLGGEVASLELPTDRPRPALQSYRGGRRLHTLPTALVARLQRFGREEGLTLYMTLLAATQALLSRQSGQPDVTVGAPVAGRRRGEIEGLIGIFLNTLALRTDLSGTPSFRELAARVRTVTLEAYSHQDVPFEAVLGQLRLDRDLSRTPLFQILFNMLNLPATSLELPGLELQMLNPPEMPSKFDMTFYLAEVASALRINLVYNADLFDEARIVDLLEQLELLLEEAMERPEAPVEALSLVSRTMRQVLPDPTEPLDTAWLGSVHELFAAQALRHPGKPAILDGGEVWSYAELLQSSRRLAAWLTENGIQPGDLVAIFAHRSAPVVQAVMGVLCSGAAFMMLDPSYPAPRLTDMLELAQPRAWIGLAAAGAVPEAVEDWLAAAGCPRLVLPAGGGQAALDHLADFAELGGERSVGPQDLACISFTSGSTGRPR